MSDALRGAAEDAPVGDVRVSVSAVRSRTRRNRALRGVANGVASAGAVALVVAGVGGVVHGKTAESAIGTGSEAPPVAVPEPGIMGDSGTSETPNACGTAFEASAWPRSGVTASVEATDPQQATGPVHATATLTANEAGTYSVGAPTVYVLWEGTIVAESTAQPGPDAWGANAGEITTVEVGTDLVSCWGTDIPAGDYALVAAIPVTYSAAAITGTAAGDASVSSPLYAITDPVPFTVPGEPVEDPFGAYLNAEEPAPGSTTVEPVIPLNSLDADAARRAYAAAALPGTWDMAPGTQRVVKTTDGTDRAPSVWTDTYFGCPIDGSTTSFPTESATLDWLRVSADFPASIHVSYGWIVDGNPVVTYAVTNTSAWSLPSYTASSPRLVLVRDGTVAAEAYPVDPSRGGVAYALDSSGFAGDIATQNGYLDPGETLRGDFLWRDVTACWSASGANALQPGTYTVLSAQDVSLGAGGVVEPAVGVNEGGTDPVPEGTDAPADTADTPAVAPAIAPAPESDFLSFTVWTSLGTVTVDS